MDVHPEVLPRFCHPLQTGLLSGGGCGGGGDSEGKEYISAHLRG